MFCFIMSCNSPNSVIPQCIVMLCSLLSSVNFNQFLLHTEQKNPMSKQERKEVTIIFHSTSKKTKGEPTKVLREIVQGPQRKRVVAKGRGFTELS